MKRQTYSTSINAPREKVWNALWDDANYREWTTAFDPGSHMVGELKKGEKILFLGNDNGGMASEVAEVIPNEYMSFRHLGIVKDGVADYDSPEAKKWGNGAEENYKLSDVNGHTQLDVELDLSEEHVEMFNGMWDKALVKLKAIAER